MTVLEPRPSRCLTIFLISAHALALICFCIANIPIAAKIILLVLCLLSFIKSRNKKLIKFWRGSQGEWYLQNHLGQIHTADLLGDSFVTRFLVILNFKIPQRYRNISLAIFPDSLDPESFRRLRAQLLWK